MRPAGIALAALLVCGSADARPLPPVFTGILDISPLYTHAWSFTHLLRRAYKGPIEEIENTTTLGTTNVYPVIGSGLVNLSEISSFCGIATCVAIVSYDQVAADNLTQATVANAPIVWTGSKPETLNGFPAALFGSGGAADFVTEIAADPVASGYGAHFVFGFAARTSTGSERVWSNSYSSGDFNQLIPFAGSGTSSNFINYFYNKTYASVPVTVGSAMAISSFYSSGEMYLENAGSLASSPLGSMGQQENWEMGNGAGVSNNQMYGYIGDMIYLNAPETVAQASVIQNRLRAYWRTP